MSILISVKNVGFQYQIRKGFFTRKKVSVLKQINIDIFAGETLGVIGGNGAGKSTLLKLIAGIYAPYTGKIQRPPDVSTSLLSLQLGFFPDLSGRDNAIMGAIFLGKSQREAREALPRIIDFSELGSWIDEPLKTYSSGMKARLGFSVAMEISPTLLLVDEVLGVGDQAFFQKSRAMMQKKMRSGQTTIFVSHNLHTVKELCSRVCWLDKGSVRMAGNPASVIESYRECV